MGSDVRKKVGRPRVWDAVIAEPRTTVCGTATLQRLRDAACGRGVRVRAVAISGHTYAVWMRDRSAPRESVSAGTGTTEEVEPQ